MDSKKYPHGIIPPTMVHYADYQEARAEIASLRAELDAVIEAGQKSVIGFRKMVADRDAKIASLCAELANTRRDAAESIMLLGGERDSLRAAVRQEADEKARLLEAATVLADELESAYPQEHGGGADDTECPLCGAIRTIRAALACRP